MSREKNEMIFEELEKFIGSAIHVIRVASRNTQAELNELLKQTLTFRFKNLTIVEEIESGEYDVSFDELEIICIVLNRSVEEVLKCALSLRDCKGISEEKMLRETLSELEYQIWKNQEESL